MPRVFQVDDKKWAQAFRYNCDELRFRFGGHHEVPARHAKQARDYANGIIFKDGRPLIPKWKGRNAISFSANLSAFSERVKHSSVTTVMETVEYYNYALITSSQSSISELSEHEKKKLLRIATDEVGKTVYYYATALVAPELFAVETWDEAALIHDTKIRRIAANLFYLVRLHAAELIVDALLETCSSPDKLQQALLDYSPNHGRLIPNKDRGNLRKRITRLVDKLPTDQLAYESAYFTVDNCAYAVMQQIRSDGYRPPRNHQQPKHGCHHFSTPWIFLTK